MKRMWSKNELKNISQNEAKAVKKDIATLVDKDGHDRFIEGNLTLKEISGVTKTYGKWSLSGTHLLIVLCLNIKNGTTIDDATDLIENQAIPQWIYDKIIPIVGVTVMYVTPSAYASDYTSVAFQFRLVKGNSNDFRILKSGAISTSKEYNVRVAFDLLIDNE